MLSKIRPISKCKNYFFNIKESKIFLLTSQAIKDFSWVIQFNSKSSSAFFNRGCCYDSLGKVNEAVADYFVAVQLDSSLKQNKRIENSKHLNISGPRRLQMNSDSQGFYIDSQFSDESNQQNKIVFRNPSQISTKSDTTNLQNNQSHNLTLNNVRSRKSENFRVEVPRDTIQEEDEEEEDQ